MRAWFAGSRLRGACRVRPDDGGLVARLEAGARLLLKYPALTIIGGLSLAGAIAIGVVGIEVAGERRPTNGCRSTKAAESWASRRRTRRRHAWSRGCSTISRSGGGLFGPWRNSAPRA